MFKRIHVGFQLILFRIVHRQAGQTFWFPGSFTLDITHIPTMEEVKKSREPVFLRGELSFRHGFIVRRSATLNVYKPISFFFPQYWRWASDGELTPGFLVERLEQRWAQRRQAMNVSLQFQAKP